MIAPYFTKDEGGSAETPEEAAANAKAAGFEYKQRKGKKSNAAPKQETHELQDAKNKTNSAPSEAMQNLSVQP